MVSSFKENIKHIEKNIMNLNNFYENGKWKYETFKNNLLWVYHAVNQIKPKKFVEFGTGKDANYAKSICKAMDENNLSETKFISYELSRNYYENATNILKNYQHFTELHCDDMFNFFKTYDDLIPDMYMLDAGDEKLWSNQNNQGDWIVEGKDYSENSYYGKGISENLSMFLEIQNSRSKIGTWVLLDDFFVGRGSYISEYILNNKETFENYWEFKNIVHFGNSSIALLRRL